MHKSKNLSSYYISTEFGSPKFVKSDALAAIDTKFLTAKNVISPNNYVISLAKDRKSYEFPFEKDQMAPAVRSTKNLKMSPDLKLVNSAKEGIAELNQRMKQMQNDKSLSGLFGTKRMKANVKNRSIVLDEYTMSINSKMSGAFRRHDPITKHMIKPARNFQAIQVNLKKVAADNIIKKVSSIPRIRNSSEKLSQINAINDGKAILTLDNSSKNLKLTAMGSTGIISPSNLHTSSIMSPDTMDNQIKNKLLSVISSDIGGTRTNPATPSNMKSLYLIDGLKDTSDIRVMPSTQPNRQSQQESTEREERFLPGKRKRANQDERGKLDRFLHDQFVIDLIAKNRDKRPEDDVENYPTIEELEKLITNKKSVNDNSEFALPEYNFLDEFKKRNDINMNEPLEIPKGYQKTKGFEIFIPENTVFRDIAKSSTLTNRYDNLDVENVPKFSRSPKSKKTTYIPEVSMRRSSPKKTIVLKPGEPTPKPPEKTEKQSIFQKLGSNRLKRLRKALREKFIKWGKINIPDQQRKFEILPKLIAGTLFTPKPYEHPGSQEFFQAVKIGDWPKVQAKLRHDRYLIYDYDHVIYFSFTYL